jgi:hypothetical protein
LLWLEDIKNLIRRIVNLFITGVVLISTDIFVAETDPLSAVIGDRELVG